MAKIKSFTDASGVTHPNCYWRITQINIDVANETGSFTFVGYADKEKREAKKQPIPGAVRNYTISGDAFKTQYAKHLAGEANLAQVGYALAESTEDVQVGFNQDTGLPVKASFFGDATDA